MSRVISEEVQISSGSGGEDLAVAAYKRTRFGSDPVQGSALPDGSPADATGTTGHDGVVTLTLPTDETYCLTWMDGSVRVWRIVLGSSPYQDVDHGLPAGGTIHQVAAKASGTDYDVHWETPSGGGGSTKLVDLGVVTAVELLAGPKTLYTFGVGEVVLGVYFDASGLVVPDNSNEVDIATSLTRPSAGYDSGGVFDKVWLGGARGGIWLDSLLSRITDPASPPTLRSLTPIQTATAIYAFLDSQAEAPMRGAWQAAHAYALHDGVTGAGHIWSAEPGGTSAGSPPDFAGHIGGSVVDGTITWNDEATNPTVGQAHIYALVATPVAP